MMSRQGDALDRIRRLRPVSPRVIGTRQEPVFKFFPQMGILLDYGECDGIIDMAVRDTENRFKLQTNYPSVYDRVQKEENPKEKIQIYQNADVKCVLGELTEHTDFRSKAFNRVIEIGSSYVWGHLGLVDLTEHWKLRLGDMLLRFGVISILVDIKGKTRDAFPTDRYDVTIPCSGFTTEGNTLYCFGQIDNSFRCLYYGMMDKVTFRRISDFIPAGSILEGSEIPTKFDCRRVRVGDLWRWETEEEARGFTTKEVREMMRKAGE